MSASRNIGNTGTDESMRELDELLGAFALDAVDSHERAAVERYLVASPAARHEVRRFHAVAEALATTPGEAPKAVWNRIQAEMSPLVSVDASSRPSARPSAHRSKVLPFGRVGQRSGQDSPSTSGPAFPPGRNPARPSRFADARSATGGAVPRLPLVGIAASMIAILALGSITMRQRSQLTDLRADAARASERAAADGQRINELRTSLQNATSDDAQVVQLLSQKGSEVADLVRDGAPLARIVVGPNGQGYLVGANLPALPNGKTYQLWGVKDGVVLSLGVFGRDPSTARFAASERWTQFVLTEEAAPGVVSSKQPAFAAGEVTSV